ncbi:LamB/YcsF family protein [Brevibacillus ruminantium]|uniref:5-oxoprolinase subunit A n=1 Tax=Brevibacillus ruminantium TaxID=2950604 RepID=A0ABY4W999_9BACL|nr:5-oxoprolinase subunit PxpA [Brevibacillus ruminantium]USG63359.1 LamB/YcsF family protein [Brevibacillus ruminantium]
MYKVDLNCDMGESFGFYQLGNDEEMMQYISSANIACGFHAGDPHVMRKTVELAKAYGVGIGAHPGFPDLLGFGRRHMRCTPDEIRDYILYQIGALREFAAWSGTKLQHCKPHGALFMMAMEDEQIACAILEGLSALSNELIVFALNGSAFEEAGRKMGMPIAREVYADREHTADGSIVMTRKGPIITDKGEMAKRVVRMVTKGRVRTPDGEDAHIFADTICIHGDTPGAVELVKEIRSAFEQASITVTPVREILT